MRHFICRHRLQQPRHCGPGQFPVAGRGACCSLPDKSAGAHTAPGGRWPRSPRPGKPPPLDNSWRNGLVSLNPHPDTPRLTQALENCLAPVTERAHDACRIARPKHATLTGLVDGEGAKKFGGRWNPPGIPAVYLSLDLSTATAELEQRHRGEGVPLNEMTPRVIVSMRVRLRRVLDLSRSETRDIIGVSLDQLCEEWQNRENGEDEPITQAIGRLAWGRRLDGLLVPSVPAKSRAGANVVVYPDHAHPGWCHIYGSEDLPPYE